ncbi:MAG TPA: MraY family glycosyltransferase [Longimicrobiaceae bacterium]|nr:MraY family glycosyltransferase [Longimicrobiaceae bacterium]
MSELPLSLLAAAFATALLASFFLTPRVIRGAEKRGLFDDPSAPRRVHSSPVPRLGGLAVFAAMLIGLGAAKLVAPHGLMVGTRLYVGFLAGAAILLAAGLVDDIRGIRPATKMAAQVAAALVVYACGFRIDLLTLGGATYLATGWLSLPLTVLWIVGVTNAFNLMDGLDGLATGIAIVALTASAAVALAMGADGLLLPSVALLGALLGFLRYNFNPARIFLGDSGSLFVGYMLAVHSVHSSMKSATAVLVIVPLFTLALPLLDTLLAILRRWLRGVPLSSADRRHIHHRLLEVGLTHRRTVLVLYAATSMLASVGLLVAFTPSRNVGLIAAAGGTVSLVLLLAALSHLDYHEFTEAGAVIARAPAKMLKVIRDRIHARDMAAVLATAESLEQVNAVLADNAENFGFLHMEVCSEHRENPRAARSRAGQHRRHRMWKLDYPVALEDVEDEEPLVLRIRCDVDDGFRPYGAERVARILAPAIQDWLTARAANGVVEDEMVEDDIHGAVPLQPVLWHAEKGAAVRSTIAG